MGRGVVRLTNNPEDEWSPVWSPDGTRIAYQKDVGGQSEIYVMLADGSSQTRLTNDGGYDGDPAWSPDNTRIAFTAFRNSQWRIWVMNALDGSGQTQLSDTAYSEDPAWSPDGTQIAYDADAATSDGWWELWVMNSNGAISIRSIILPAIRDAYPRSWSPDGAYISLHPGSNGCEFDSEYWYWV